MLDKNVTAELPEGVEVLSVSDHATSAWAKASRIGVRLRDGSEESYFMKVSVGEAGLDAIKGEFQSTSAIHKITPEFCPKPIAYGTLATDPNSHFYVCKFYNFNEGLPEITSFCEKLARLHSSHTSPEGKFGFHCTTYNGNLPQDNSWADSWEKFFDKGLRHALRVREARAGPNQELNELLPVLFDKIIPRLLRPLESDGRQIKPSLVHGDLWAGNVATNSETGEVLVFDAGSFWAHNEYELGNWRPERCRFTDVYFEEYHTHNPRSEPVEDWDGRNALYAVRFDIHGAAIFPLEEEFVQLAIEGIRRLADRYSDGYQG